MSRYYNDIIICLHYSLVSSELSCTSDFLVFVRYRFTIYIYYTYAIIEH